MQHCLTHEEAQICATEGHSQLNSGVVLVHAAIGQTDEKETAETESQTQQRRNTNDAHKIDDNVRWSDAFIWDIVNQYQSVQNVVQNQCSSVIEECLAHQQIAQ